MLPQNVTIGKDCIIDRSVHFDTSRGGNIVIGNDCKIGIGVILATHGGDIIIGDNVSINHYCVVYGHGGLTIKDNVAIATHTVIIPANHKFLSKDKPIKRQGQTKKGIVIDQNVWIGAHCCILDGVHIATGSVIGAGSVITRNTLPYSIYKGVPSRLSKIY